MFHGIFELMLLVNIMFSKVLMQKFIMKTGCVDLPEVRYLLQIFYRYLILNT